MKKILTLVLIESDGKVLLGMKKRGFGEGRWNGFGGKLAWGETIQEAAVREVEEETQVQVQAITQVGLLTFSFESDPTLVLEVHVFKTNSFQGEPTETEEMKPQWFLSHEIPYDDMWPDDVYWLPMVLDGKLISGSFHLDAPASSEHQASILRYTLKEVADF